MGCTDAGSGFVFLGFYLAGRETYEEQIMADQGGGGYQTDSL